MLSEDGLLEKEGSRSAGRAGRLSGSALKLLGAFSMLIDHIGVVLIERGILKSADPIKMSWILRTEAGRHWWYVDRICRCVGRLAFPIFVYLLVEGAVHTRHRKAYGLRLLLFALLAEIPFDLALSGRWSYLGYQNVLFTLLFIYLTLCGIQASFQQPVRLLLWVLAGCGAAQVFRTDYGAFGVILAVLLYWTRGSGRQLMSGALLVALESCRTWGMAALAFIPLAFYDGKRGRWPGRYFFYVFYPAHLFVLYLVREHLLG